MASIKANPKYVVQAKKLIGKKAGLQGGGMMAQYTYIVKVKDVTKDGHAVLQIRGWDYPDSKTTIFQPLLMSWHLEPLAKGFGHLPLGRYDLLSGYRDRPRKPAVKIAKRSK